MAQKNITQCPIGFRVLDGRLVPEGKVLELPPKEVHRGLKEGVVKGKIYPLSPQEAHERLWGVHPHAGRQRYVRSGHISTS